LNTVRTSAWWRSMTWSIVPPGCLRVPTCCGGHCLHWRSSSLSSLAAHYRRSRRAAGLTWASTAPGAGMRVGAANALPCLISMATIHLDVRPVRQVLLAEPIARIFGTVSRCRAWRRTGTSRQRATRRLPRSAEVGPTALLDEGADQGARLINALRRFPSPAGSPPNGVL
jgi:hypothetical protein